MQQILFSMTFLAGLSGVAFGQTAPASEIAPGGKLRVGMIAITVLGGVAEPVAKFIGQKLGAAKERNWNADAERLGGLEVQKQLNFRALLDRQIRRLFALENLRGDEYL